MKQPLKYCKIPIRLIPIEEDGFHLMVTAYINRKKANLLIDTGASKTVFDLQRIRNFIPEGEHSFERNPHMSTGLGSSTIESHMTTLKAFRIGDISLKDFPTVLLDMAVVNQSYALLGIPAIDGVIGSDLLKTLRAQINFLSSSLKMYYPVAKVKKA